MEQRQINCEGSFGGSSAVVWKCLEAHSLLLVLEHCYFLFHQMVPLLFPHICVRVETVSEATFSPTAVPTLSL